MKALSVRQPWAWLLAMGYKPIENRTWYGSYRGRLLIHAAKTADEMSLPKIIDYYGLDIPAPEKVELKFGGVIGAVDMVDCIRVSDCKWFHGPFGFVFKNPELLPFRACRGWLGFFDIEDAQLPLF